MLIKITNEFDLELQQDVIGVFKNCRKRSGKSESGGILLGSVFKNLISIDMATIPNKKDKAGLFFFKRNVDVAQSIVDKAWDESDGRRIYLGEWHTHLEESPNPSKDDIKLLIDMFENSKIHTDFLLMIIVGTRECLVLVKTNY